MDLRKLRTGEWIALASGVALIVALFLPWYGDQGDTASGWASLTVIDVVLCVCALFGIAQWFLTAQQPTSAVPLAVAGLGAWAGILATILTLIRVIDAPADGAVVGRDVEVTGEAAVFEATVPWVVVADGVVVESGFANSAEGQRFSPFSFTVTLEPGEYVVRVAEDDPSGGEGRPPFTDDKRITVTG
ncbi:MAG: Gmad2 immunoglobulin-like domain-containing protein [Actinobacteria bacterium]|nr:Gmad2 immunoglobulin-like domain-containing protein [Actinomycetota bacterium]